MKITKSYIRKLILESLNNQSLLIERKSDKYYEVILKSILEIVSNPKENMISLGWYDYTKNTVKFPGGKWRLGRNHLNKFWGYFQGLDFYFQEGFRIKMIPELEGYRNFYMKSFMTGSIPKKRTARNNLIFCFVPRPDIITEHSKKCYNLFGSNDKFLSLSQLEQLFSKLCIALYPDMGNAGGSMNSSGIMRINCYYRRNTRSLNNLPSPEPLDPFSFQDVTPISSLELVKTSKYYGTKSGDDEIKKLNLARIDRKMKQIENNTNALIDALNWASLTEENFSDSLAENKHYLKELIIHEGAHFINQTRAKLNNPNVRDTDSGLKNLFDKEKKENPEKYVNSSIGSKTYTLSTEELSARFHELRYTLEKILNIGKSLAYGPPQFKLEEKLNLKERQEKLFKVVRNMRDKPSRHTPGSHLAPILDYLFENKTSEAANFLANMTFTMVNPFDKNKKSIVDKDNFIINTIFATYGPKGTWETREGKRRLQRVHGRIIDLVKYVDTWLKENNFKE